MLKRTVKKLPTKSNNIGGGLWEGICGLAQWLWDMVSGWISGIWDGICGFFGIHSPSKLFRDELGKNLMLGFSIGIDSNADEVQKSIDRINESVADTSISAMTDLNSNLSDFNSSAMDISSSYSTPTVSNTNAGVPSSSINISFGDVTINSDDDIESLADKIDLAISQRITMKGMVWN